VGVLCTDPQVECDLPGGDECVIEPGANCAGRPAYQDPNFSQVFGNGQIAVQTASPSILGGSVVTVFDLSNINAAPLDSWFSLNRYSHPDWDQSKLGSVFGLAVDSDGDIFVTSTRSWSSDYQGIGGWGAVYRLDRITGNVSVFANLPNTMSGLGSITWDCDHDVFFVSNMEDGLIYRLDTNGNILDTFDPALPWNGMTGPVELGDRPWAVEVHAGRLYFSMWNENALQAIAGASNEIWSVALDASGMPVGAAVLEVTMPAYGSTDWSAPVADIRFSPRGTMLLAERSMMNFELLSAHKARVLEYECQAGGWVPSGNTFSVGEGGGTNATGGVDADLNRTWAAGDALHLNHPAPYQNIYGFQGMPATGGTITDSVLIDYQDNLAGQDKTMIGDLVVTEAADEPCMNVNFFDVKCRYHHHNGVYHKVDFGFSAMGSGTIAEVQVTGPSGVTITPGTLVGPYPPYQSYPVSVRMYGAPGGQPICLTLTAIFTDGSVCVEELCFETPICHEPWPGDVNYDFKVDITDLLAIIERWGDQCDGEEDCTADQDGDGTIGIGDLLIVLENWSSR
ncbi:MAG: dockerin type I domain-containing protein, partial [Phycisphaerales bacterium]|nr:dockerin type I domain-containing protein [Phycisphaerales bacterium]